MIAWFVGVALLWDQNPAERSELEEIIGWLLFLAAPVAFLAIAITSALRWWRER